MSKKDRNYTRGMLQGLLCGVAIGLMVASIGDGVSRHANSDRYGLASLVVFFIAYFIQTRISLNKARLGTCVAGDAHQGVTSSSSGQAQRS
jgi:hypothetical protein